MRDIINEIMKIVLTALEPVLISIIDIITMVVEIEKRVLKNVAEVESNFIRNILNIIKIQ